MNIKEFSKDMVGKSFLDDTKTTNEIVWVRDDLKLITVEYSFYGSPLRTQAQYNIKEFNMLFVEWR